jgi:hypothetical protein
MTSFVLFAAVWLIFAGYTVISAVLFQARSVGPSILVALLLGPIAPYVIRRLPLRDRTPGWYPWWDGFTNRHRHWDGQAWTDEFFDDGFSTPTVMRAPPPGWYPNPDGTEGQRWWDGQAWTQPPPVTGG